MRRLGLALMIIIILGVSFGCNQNNGPESKSNIYTNVGFVDDMITEDGKDYVEIGINGGSLKLKVENKDVFQNLEQSGFYKFAYDDSNILLSIETDRYIEDLVKESMKPGIEAPNEKYIQATGKVSTEGLALLDSYNFDINGDGIEETISMYVDAEQGSDGEIYWDDGQQWLFLVEGEEEDYILFHDYIQIGILDFHIYTEGDDLYITTIQSGTANLDVVEYKFDPLANRFTSSSKYGATGNVIMLHSSYGY